jgi:hypothetical protein
LTQQKKVAVFHVFQVSNFSPFGVMEIFFATAVCGIPAYISILPLGSTWP